MKSLLAFCIALFSVSFLIGCSDDPAASNNTIQQLFPMTVGNEWKTQFERFDEAGNSTSIDTGFIRIDSAGTSLGQNGFFASSDDGPIFFYYKGNDLWSQDHPDYGSDTSFLLRYPMAANEILVLEDTTYSDGYRRQSLLKLISESTSVNVPAGTFDCVVYMNYTMYGKGTLDTTSYDILSFAFGKGYIKNDDYYRTSSTSKFYLHHTSSLIKATIK